VEEEPSGGRCGVDIKYIKLSCDISSQLNVLGKSSYFPSALSN
jgi:hypothetical protein